jgi:hypothetical protein
MGFWVNKYETRKKGKKKKKKREQVPHGQRLLVAEISIA